MSCKHNPETAKKRPQKKAKKRVTPVGLAALYGARFYNQPPKQAITRRRRRPKRRDLAMVNKDITVLFIHENTSLALSLQRDLKKHKTNGRSFKAFTIGKSELALKAVDRYKPDVIVAANWFHKSHMGYNDIMLPIIKAYKDSRIIVLASPAMGNKTDLPVSGVYFHGRGVINTTDKKWDELLFTEIYETAVAGTT